MKSPFSVLHSIIRPQCAPGRDIAISRCGDRWPAQKVLSPVTELRWKPVESQWYSHPKDDGTLIYRNMGLLLGLLYMGFYRGYYTTVGGSIHDAYS
jgi:hypothetical protein